MKHIKIYENKENTYFDNFIKDQDIIFKMIKMYLNTYEKDITNLKINNIIRIKYSSFYPRTIKIWFQDNRPQFDFHIELNDTQTKNLIDYINNPELFKITNKYNL